VIRGLGNEEKKGKSWMRDEGKDGERAVRGDYRRSGVGGVRLGLLAEGDGVRRRECGGARE